MSFSIEVFRALQSSNQTVSYYVPSNTSHNEFDITVDLRTRYTHELEALRAHVIETLDNGIPDSITYDLPYPSLEVHQDLAAYWVSLLNNETTFADPGDIWGVSTIAPAATDASFIQNPTIDKTTFELLSADRVVFHPNFKICEPGSASCPFNHEPGFAGLAGLPYAYKQSERVARGLAYTAVNMANDPAFMESVQAITRK